MQDIIFIIAPDIPVGEVKKLRREVDKALEDNDYPVVVNYPVTLQTVESNRTRKILVVCAPSVPASEINALREHVIEAIDDPDYTVVTNYHVTATVYEI